MQTGQAFNPYGLFNGSYIPETISRLTDLSANCKIVYGRLLRYAGADGKCYPSVTRLALETGGSHRQTQRYLATLEEYGLIRRISRRGEVAGNLPNQIVFLWHPCFDIQEFPLPEDDGVAEPQEGASDEAEKGCQSVHPLTAEMAYKESHLRESVKESQEPSPPTPPSEEPHTEPNPIYEQNLVRGIYRYVRDWTGEEPAKQMLKSQCRKHLVAQDKRISDEDQGQEWREKLTAAVKEYLEDPSIGTIEQKLQKCWAPRSSYTSVARDSGSSRSPRPEPVRSKFEEDLRKIAESEDVVVDDARIPSWQIHKLEAWKLDSPDGFEADFRENCISGASFGAVVNRACDAAEDRKRQKRSHGRGQGDILSDADYAEMAERLNREEGH